MIHGVPVVELHRTEITEQQNVGGDMPDLEGIGNRRLFDGHSLGADTHGETQMLRRRRQVAVYFTRQLETTRHGGNQNGRSKPLAQKSRADIDLVNVELWQRVVDEAIAVEPRAEMTGNAGRVQTDFEVFFF